MTGRKLRIASCILFWILAAGIILLMFVFSGQSGEESGNLSAKLAGWLLERLPFIRMDREPFEHILRKAAHFGLFALEGFFVCLALYPITGKRRAWIIAAAICAVLAVLNELHQLLDPDRACRVTDMLLDFAGSLCGILAAAAAKRLFRRSDCYL